MFCKTLAMSLGLIGGAIALASEPQTQNQPTVNELLAKIEKLEMRVKELEKQSAIPSQLCSLKRLLIKR